MKKDFETAVVVFAAASLVMWVAVLARFFSMEERVRFLEARPVHDAPMLVWPAPRADEVCK